MTTTDQNSLDVAKVESLPGLISRAAAALARATTAAEVLDAKDQATVVTTRLAEIAASFSKLKQAGEAFENVATELKSLPERLSETASSIRDVGHNVVEQQQKLTQQIQDTVRSILTEAGTGVAEKIEQGTQNFVRGVSDSTAGLEETLHRIEAMLDRFGSNQNAYLEGLKHLTANNADLNSSIGAISKKITTAAESV